MNTSIRGRTTDRRNGKLVIRTEMGIHMSFKDNGLPLFIPVLVLYDYTTNQIKDVVKEEKLLDDHIILKIEPEPEETEEEDNDNITNYSDKNEEDGDIVFLSEEPLEFEQHDEEWY